MLVAFFDNFLEKVAKKELDNVDKNSKIVPKAENVTKSLEFITEIKITPLIDITINRFWVLLVFSFKKIFDKIVVKIGAVAIIIPASE